MALTERIIVIGTVHHRLILARLAVIAAGALLFSPGMYAQCDSRSLRVKDRAYPKIIIHDVKFDGEITLPESDTEQFASKLKKEELYAEPHWVDEMEARARGLWQDRGFFQVLVDLETSIFSTDSSGEHVFLDFHVQEGSKHWLKEIRFRKSEDDEEGVAADSESDSAASLSALIFPTDQLRKAFPLQDGELFRADKVRDGLDALKKLFGSSGYIDFVATPLTVINDEDHKVILTIELYLEKQYRLESVEAIGLAPNQERELQSAIPTGEIFRWDSFVKIAQSFAPPDWSPDRIGLSRNTRTGLVDATIDFRPCLLVQGR